MIMITWPELILNDHESASDIVGQDVQPVAAHLMLSFPQLQSQTEMFGQAVKVVGDPGSEVVCLGLPAVPHANSYQTAKLFDWFHKARIPPDFLSANAD